VSGATVRQTAGDTAAPSPRTPPSAALSPWPILLTDEQAAAALNVSVRRFHELREQPWCPRPIVLGPRQLRWSMAELSAAVAAMPRQEAKAEPSQLAKARRARIESMKTAGQRAAG
jgi:hypothetical protein